MKKITSALVLGTIILSSASVFADDNVNSHSKGVQMGQKDHVPHASIFKNLDEDTRSELRANQEAMMMEIKEVKEAVADFKSLSEDEQADLLEAIKDIQDSYHEKAIEILGDNQEEIDALNAKRQEQEERQNEQDAKKAEFQETREEILAMLDEDTREEFEALEAERKEFHKIKHDYSDLTESEKTQIKEEMLSKQEEFIAARAEILADYPNVIEKLDDLHAQMRQGAISKMRDGNSEDIVHRDDAKTEKRKEHKRKFANKLGNRLDNMSEESLEIISEKIHTLIATYSDDSSISEAKREEVLSMLEAISELVDEAMGIDSTDDIFDDIFSEQ